MVNELKAMILWTFAIALATATVLAVSGGHSLTPKQMRWFFGLQRWLCLPLLGFAIVLPAVLTVSAVGVYFWFKDRSDFDNQLYDAVLGLHVAVLGLLYFFTRMFFTWKNMVAGAVFMVFAFGAATAALIIMGIEGNDANNWLPFGLYFALPVFLAYATFQALWIWAKNRCRRSRKSKSSSEMYQAPPHYQSSEDYAGYPEEQAGYDDEPGSVGVGANVMGVGAGGGLRF